MHNLILSSLLSAVAVYSHPMNPREHPDDARRAVKPPDKSVLGERLRFSSVRNLSTPGWKSEIEKNVYKDRLGDVLWPIGQFNAIPHLNDVIAYIKDHKDILLFDASSGWPDKRDDLEAQDRVSAMLERELGPRWLGWDLGEQDGRYVMCFSDKIHPYGGDRLHQYLHFQDFFENGCRMLSNRPSTLISCNFGHYFLRESCFSSIGAETALSLPNSQVYYAFIRGAGKRHGVPWFGNISVWNRWGWKAYNNEKPKVQTTYEGSQPLPERGTSLALMKRLMYSHIFYNCWLVGIENCFYWFTKGRTDELSPIGVLQRDAREWSERNGNPGIMHTPVALVFDFYSGWTYPRHHYDYGMPYRVWGNLPYRMDDYFAADVLGMLYPGYEDSGYYHDERGFQSPTPYGDIAECLLSDTPVWLLKQYPVLVLANAISPSAEFSDKMQAYLDAGGLLVMTRGNAKNLPGLKGRVTVIDSEWGVEETAQCKVPPVFSMADRPLPNPHPLKPSARQALDRVFREQMIFTASDAKDGGGLSLVTCRRGKGEYTVLVENGTWSEKPFALKTKTGRILSVKELPTTTAERKARGWLPECIATNGTFSVGRDTANTIAAQGVRIFRVQLEEGDGIREIGKITPPAGPRGISLALRGGGAIKEQILRRPTFFEHYDGVMVDWKYLRARDRKELERERNWIGLQGLHVTVDMSQAFNWFPDLDWYAPDRKNARIAKQNRETLDDVLGKMPVLGARDLVVALDGRWEWTPVSYTNRAVKALNELCRLAAPHGVTVHLRQSPRRFIQSVGMFAWWVNAGSEPNLRAAPALAGLFAEYKKDIPAEKIARDALAFAAKPGLLLVAAPGTDDFGRLVSLHEPIAASRDWASAVVKAFHNRGDRIVFEAVYPDADSEYADVKALKSALKANK